MPEAAGEYREAPEIAELAWELIQAHHPGLQEATIVYLVSSKDAKQNGVPIVGQASKVTDKERLVHDTNVQFVLTIHGKNFGPLSDKQKSAHLDHLLCHCRLYEGSPHIVPHDLDEFAGVISRHGLYDVGAIAIAAAIQPHLPGLEGAARPEPAPPPEPVAVEKPERPSRRTRDLEPAPAVA